jgi:hypothetical protein
MSNLRAIRVWIVIFMVGLVVSGVTAFPLQTELRVVSSVLHAIPAAELLPGLVQWIDRVRDALTESGAQYPFLAYGTDWLGFAHLVIAVAFIGPLMDPVRNIWVLRFAMIACAMVIPFAFIAGSIRGIPVGWQLIDMSFGVLGVIPLIFAYRRAQRLATPAAPRIVPDTGVEALPGRAQL